MFVTSHNYCVHKALNIKYWMKGKSEIHHKLLKTILGNLGLMFAQK